MEIMRRGEVFNANLSPVIGSEQGGTCPVLIVQNNKGNLFSPTLIVAPITRNINKKKQPTQVMVNLPLEDRLMPSLILLEQLRTLDKERMLHKICQLREEDMQKINRALRISVGLR